MTDETETKKETNTDAMGAYVEFLQETKNPPALDKSRHGFTTTYPHLIDFLKPKLTEKGLGFFHTRNDEIVGDNIYRVVECYIVHEDGTTVASGSAIIHEHGLISKEDWQAGHKPILTDDSLEAAETRLKRRLLADLCGISPDAFDPNQHGDYEAHERNQVIMDAQKQVLSQVEDEEGLEKFWDDICKSKSLTNDQKNTIKEWTRTFAVERGWKSEDDEK